jgi:ClpP class serine protease
MTAASFEARRYERAGMLAIDPSALLEMYVMSRCAPPNEERPEATIVTIRGPLDKDAGSWCDSYEAICARVADACTRPAPAIVLRIDSPGGEAAGCIEAAKAIRAMCARANKPLYAYVDGKACSAAYAIASAAKTITLADTAIVGSIGILSTRTDVSAANALQGLRVAFVASGSRKADGNPDAPITDSELTAAQELVDSMALVFFELVADMRATTVEAIAALQAGVFHGASAIGKGLANAMQPLSTLLALVASPAIGANNMPPEDDKKKGDDKKETSPFESARAALEETAKGDDANAAAAKRALAALAEQVGEEKAEAEAEPEKAEDKKEDATAASALALKAMTEVHKLKASLAERDERDERNALLSAHSDLSPEMLGLLQKAPIALVRETLKDLPVAKPSGDKISARARITASAQADVRPSQGKDQIDGGAARLPADEKRALDIQMGLVAQSAGVKNSEFKLTLGGLEAAASNTEANKSPALS